MLTYAIISLTIGILLGSYVMYKVKDFVIGVCVIGGMTLGIYMVGVVAYLIAVTV